MYNCCLLLFESFLTVYKIYLSTTNGQPGGIVVLTAAVYDW